MDAPIICEPGTYMDDTASSAASCKQCEEGLYCPLYGMSIGISCPTYHYCEEYDDVNDIGTIQPTLCPNGYECEVTDLSYDDVLPIYHDD